MNRTYRLIFNRSLGLMQVASETASGGGARTVSSPRCRVRRLLSLLLLGALPATGVQAQEWTGAVDNNWNTYGNWNGGVPNSAGTLAEFGAPGVPTSVSPQLSSNVTLHGILFGVLSPEYTFSTSNHALTIGSFGVLNLSNQLHTFQIEGQLGFVGAGSAGTNTAYVVAEGGTMHMQGTSSLETASVELQSGGVLSMLQSSSGGQARIIGNGGTVMLQQQSAVMTMGSLEGNGSVIFAGPPPPNSPISHSLSIGSLNTNTLFSGRITTLGGGIADGSLTKTGLGTLTLTGDNTYGLGTTVQQGTLEAGHHRAFGSGAVSVADGATWALRGGIIQTNLSTIAGIGHTAGGRVGAIENFSGNNAVTGRVTLAGQSTIAATAGVLTLTGGVDVGTHDFALFAGNGAQITVQGNGITGTGQLLKQGAGTLVLNDSHTYSGGTYISGGTLQLGSGGNPAGILGIVINHGVLTFNHSGNSSFSTAIHGLGAVVKSGSGTLILSGDATHTGGTTIESGTLQIGGGPGSTAGLLTGDVINDGTLSFYRNGALTFAGSISGTGNLLKQGSGQVTLTGTNSYFGTTSIAEGTLAMGNGSAVGVGNVILSNGAQLLAATSLSETFGWVVTDNGRLSAATGHTFNVTGLRLGSVGSGGSLYIGDVGDIGRVMLSGGAGAYFDGPLAVNVQHGSLGFGDAVAADGLAANQGTLQLAANTTVDLNGFDVSASHLAGVGQLTNQSSTAARLIVGGEQGDTGSAQGDSLFNGSITDGAGTFALVKEGARGLTLTGANTYSGGTQINGGRVVIEDIAALGTGDVTLNNGAELLGGVSGIDGFGRLVTSHGRVSASAGETFSVESYNLTTQPNGGLTIGSVGNTGTVVLRSAPGSSIMEEFKTQVEYGTLRLGDGFTSRTLSAVGGELHIGAAGTTDLNGLLYHASHLTGDGHVVNSATGAATLSVGSQISSGAGNVAADSVFGGVIADGAGTVGLVKHGNRTLTLTGTHTYTGGTSINGGTLAVNGAIAGDIWVDSLGTLGGSGQIGGNVFVNGVLSAGNSPGTLAIAGDLSLNAGSTTVFELGQPGVVGGAYNDLIRVGGDLTLGGDLEVATASAGWYRLFEHTGTLSGAFANETVTSSQVGFTVASHALDSSVAGQVNLSVLGAGQTLQFWDGSDVIGDNALGGGDGTWGSFGTNWTDSVGSANAGWGSSVAVFAGAAGTVTVDGSQSFDTLQFVTDGYTLTGGSLALSPASGGSAFINVGGGASATVSSALVDGAGTDLTKVGAGTLHLTGSNTYSGTTTIAAGTLVTGVGNMGAGDVVNDGMFELQHNGAVADFGNDISGGGAVHKTGTGAVRLTGQNTYSGGTTIAAGTLVAGIDNLGSGDIVNEGVFELHHSAADTDFSNDLSGSGDFYKHGVGAVRLTGSNTYSGGVVVAEGRLIGAADSFGTGLLTTNAILELEQQTAATLANVIAGAGEFHKTGAGVLTVTADSSGFSGQGTVLEGGLAVDGVLGGQWSLSSGTTLSGSGAIGTTLLQGGSRVSPGGAQLGTLTVDGDLTFAAGAVYALDITVTTSDLIRVTGAATLADNNIELTALDPQTSYQDGHSYTILSAGNGVTGEFGEVLSDSAFLTTTLAYEGDAIQLRIGVISDGGERPPNVFPTVAGTGNQASIAHALDSLAQSGDALALYNALLLLNAADARAAFDSLSGEVHASTRAVLLEDRFLQNGIDLRLSGRAPSEQRGAASAWLTGASTSPKLDGNGNGAAMRTRSQGLTAGVDWSVGEQALIGVAMGRQQLDHSLRARGSSAEATGTMAELYAQSRWGGWSLQGGVSHSDYRIDTVRHVQAGQLGQRITSTTDADATTVHIEAAWRADLGSASIQPYLAVSGSRLKTDATRERGGNTALEIEDGRDELLMTTTGLRAAWAISDAFALTSSVGWQYSDGDLTGNSTHRFVTGSNAFTVQSAPLARNTAVGELGASVRPTANSRISLSAQGRRGDGHSELGAQLQWQVGL